MFGPRGLSHPLRGEAAESAWRVGALGEHFPSNPLCPPEQLLPCELQLDIPLLMNLIVQCGRFNAFLVASLRLAMGAPPVGLRLAVGWPQLAPSWLRLGRGLARCWLEDGFGEARAVFPRPRTLRTVATRIGSWPWLQIEVSGFGLLMLFPELPSG
jgi:hypothetical protein